MSTSQGGLPGKVNESELNQWPIQIHLVQPGAPFFKNRELVVLSTCAPIASADVHWRFVRGRGVAARSRKELLYLVGMFVAGQALACVLVPAINWNPAPRFVEAAAALTIAYLAVEVLLLPKAGQRWLVVGVLGVFHGLYLSLFLRETRFSMFYVLPGAAAADATGSTRRSARRCRK